jgi:hypothetical protein
VKLRQRFRVLMTTGFSTAAHEVRLAVEWIENQPALRAILAEAALVEPNLDFDAFYSSFQDMQGELRWPSLTEQGRARLVWDLMKRHAAADRAGVEQGEAVTSYYGEGVDFGTGNLDDMWRRFAERVIQPLIDFLDERVGDQSSVLFVLERNVHMVEWFDRDALHAAFEADRANGEEVYNLNLQRFLFQEGGYITHAKARSASGEADLIGGLDTDDPLVCEGKLLDNRGKSYLARGFHQVIKYAHDYNQSVAYLVVFNMTDRLLQFPTDGPTGAWPPYIEMAGVRVYFIGIRALPPAATASKAGKATTVTLTRDDLSNPDAALPGDETT